MAYRIFLSTLPARGATRATRPFRWCWPISIHAPREGSDVRADKELLALRRAFLSTLPARGATA